MRLLSNKEDKEIKRKLRDLDYYRRNSDNYFKTRNEIRKEEREDIEKYYKNDLEIKDKKIAKLNENIISLKETINKLYLKTK